MSSPLEITLVIAGLSLWLLFPIGMFLSMSHVDKNSDQKSQFKKLNSEAIKTNKI